MKIVALLEIPLRIIFYELFMLGGGSTPLLTEI